MHKLNSTLIGLTIALVTIMLAAPAGAQGHPALSLVDDARATDHATASGAWSDPAIWQSGSVPGDEARIIIFTTARYN